MEEDFYKVLGVSRNASQADIQKAYRDLARKYHPDMNPKDKTAKEKFQRVQQAFDVLNDPSKRELYDRYGSSFEGMGAAGGAGAGPQTTWRTYTAGEAPFEDIDFSQFFGERFGGGAGYDPSGGFADIFSQFSRAGGGTRRGGRRAAGRGTDIVADIHIPFQTAVLGGEAELTIKRASGKTEAIHVKIPAGVDTGKKIRLRGQGDPAPEGGPPGDILLTVHVTPHVHFHRRGENLYVDVPISLDEAVAGAKVDVPTPRGTVSLKIPPGTSSGAKLRIRGHGVHPKGGAPGDLFATVRIMLPPGISDEERKEIERIAKRYPFDPRRDLRW